MNKIKDELNLASSDELVNNFDEIQNRLDNLSKIKMDCNRLK